MDVGRNRRSHTDREVDAFDTRNVRSRQHGRANSSALLRRKSYGSAGGILRSRTGPVLRSLALTASLIVPPLRRLSVPRIVLARPIGLATLFAAVLWCLSCRSVLLILAALSAGWFLAVLPPLLRLAAIRLFAALALRLRGLSPLWCALGTAWRLVLRPITLSFAALFRIALCIRAALLRHL